MKRCCIFILALLLVLSACSKSECKTDVDCSRPHFFGTCTEGSCVYSPIPNKCGNLQCESSENKCTCPQDCGQCIGKVPNSISLTQQCVNNICVEDVASSKPYFSVSEIASLGDKFSLDTSYNQPFNTKKDLFNIRIGILSQAAANNDVHIKNVELSATTNDKRTIVISRKDVDKSIWPGTSFSEDLIIDFPSVDIEGDLTNLVLKIYYDFIVTQSGKKTVKESMLQNKYKDKFVFVIPSVSSGCPSSCDDSNPGTRDYCSAQTGYFCRHDPIPNVCGNFKCDGNENKCTCPQDCGPCSGSAGNFLDYSCESNACVAVLKSGVSFTPNTIFDDRSLGPVQLHNNYRFNSPFKIKSDDFVLEMKVYRQDPSVSEVLIESVKILEGSKQLADVSVDKKLGSSVESVSIKIPSIGTPEEEHSLTIGVWYRYVQDGKEKSGKFEKSLGKITLLNI